MPNPLKSDVHVDKPLTTISIAYLQSNADYVANRVFPVVPVTKQSDKYFIYDKGDFWRDTMKKRAPSTESAGGGYSQSTGTYSCDVWSLHKDIDDQIRGNYDAPLDADRDATEWLTQQFLTRREKQFVTDYMSPGVWGKDVAGTSGTPTAGTSVKYWSDDASNPIEDVEYYLNYVKSQTGYFLNKLVMGYAVWSKLKNHPDILDRIRVQTGPKVTVKQAVAEMMGVEEILVAQSVENTAEEGEVNSFDFIIKDIALLCYAAPRPSLLQPSAGYIMSWAGLYGAGAEGQRISRLRLDWIRSDRIEVDAAFDMKVIATDLGVLFTDLVA